MSWYYKGSAWEVSVVYRSSRKWCFQGVLSSGVMNNEGSERRKEK